MASLRCAQLGLPEIVLHWLEFILNMNSLGKIAKPHNGGGNEEVLYHGESLSSLCGLKSQLLQS